MSVKLRASQADLAKVGMPVALLAESLGQEVTGVVASIGELTTDQSADGGGSTTPYRLVTVIPSKALPAQWDGQDVRATITSARTGSAVLVVPLSAVSSGADAKTTVSVLGDDGSLTRVEVRAGVSGNGYVEVLPLSGGSLEPGDHVVVSAQP